jgi:hypothetical protein
MSAWQAQDGLVLLRRHVAGQQYYDSTVVDTYYGERWFCSEAEAVAAGWSKSYR